MTRSAQQTYIQRLGFQDKDRSNQRHGLACEYLFDHLVKQTFLSDLRERANSSFDDYINSVALAIKNGISRRDHLNETGQANREKFEKCKEEAAKQFWKGKLDQSIDLWQTMSNAIDFNRSHYEALVPFRGSIDPIELEGAIRAQLPASASINVPIAGGYKGQYINGFADVLLNQQVSFKFDEAAVAEGQLLNSWEVNVWNHSSAAVLGEVKITPEPAENVIQQIAFYRTFLPLLRRVVVLVDYDAPTLKRLTKGSDIEVYRLGQKFEDWIAEQSAPSVEEL